MAGELKKMTAFIHQEALEKAKEIHIKADEEFAIEKSKLVRQETSSIDSQYAKKHKQASMSQQITRSTLANKTRIKVLSARQELLDELFEKARDKLATYSEDKGNYEGMCKGLILEGLYALNEDKVTVRARKADYEVVKKAINGAKKEYKENLDKDVNVELDEKNPQPEGSYGSRSSAYPIISRVLTSIGLGVFQLWAEVAGLISTTPSMNASSYWRPMLYPWSGQLCSVRMRTVGFTIDWTAMMYSCIF